MPASEKVIELIRKLQNIRFDRGANPNEVELAAVKIKKLLEEHQLTLFDVEQGRFSETVLEESLVITNPGEDEPVDQKTVPEWASELACSVAYPNDCRVIFSYRPIQNDHNGLFCGEYARVINFIGHESDVKVSTYLYNTLSRLLWHMAGRQSRRNGMVRRADFKKYRQDFVRGAARAIHRRLKEERDASMAAPVTGGKSTALVHVKSAAVKDYVDRNYKTLKNERTKDVKDYSGFMDGFRAGNEVPLRKGVEGQKQQYLPGAAP